MAKKRLCAVALLFAGAAFALSATVEAKDNDQFTVVLDPGHGGHDHGAIDNGAKEKDINLAVALKVGELCRKKLKDTKIVFTRDDDTFISLQKRADIANYAKADFFISIHTNSVDAKNKNRATVAGASVYTQGPHKDDANLEIARRENSVIELENGYEQKYSGFDPNRDESYIIFEMAQKKNLSESARFAKDVQQNLVKYAERKDRGVHQAGFWVLWSTSMPSVLIELDFICNPQSAKFMTSKEGVDKLAEAIFQTIKVYEQNYLQKQRMIEEQLEKEHKASKSEKKENIKVEGQSTQKKDAPAKAKGGDRKSKKSKKKSNVNSDLRVDNDSKSEGEEIIKPENVVAIAKTPVVENKDLSHANLQATQSQRKPKYNTDGRRRRSTQARMASSDRDFTLTGTDFITTIQTVEANTPNLSKDKPEVIINEIASDNSLEITKEVAKENAGINNNSMTKEVIKENTSKEQKVLSSKNSGENAEDRHAGNRKSLRSKREKN
ncbi:MAG: hypothetical protein HDR48_04615 [Bacteroides sp.]|nr:hypothetical protein [Bacteroides sp.]